MADDGDGPSGKQVIARAAAVLRALEGQDQGLSLAQIARNADLPRSTVQRIVSALEAQQLVVAGASGVRLGPALARLAASAHTDVVALSRPHLEAAGRATRETVHLSVVRGEHAILVEQYASDQELRVVSSVGAALPLHCTAHGKALLADLDDAAVEVVVGSTLERRTARTITGLPALLEQLDTVRTSGFARDHEEHAEGVCALGTTLRTGTAERYGLSIVAPALRFVRDSDALWGALTRCRSAIEDSLGMR